ncbi:MAG: stage III sporulation protein AE [Ruminococcaceae bacterium]|nr:stage III sporulation protein AE [Oscillospiraceae bacterium]
MTRAYASLLRFAALLALLTALSVPVHAAQLPETLRALLPEEIAASEELGGVLAAGTAWLRDTVTSSLGAFVRGGVRNAALLTLTAMICGAAEGLCAPAGEDAARYVPYCGVLTAAALAAGDLRALIGLGAQTVEELATLGRLLLPTLAAAMAAGGYVSTAGVWQVTTLMVCGLLNNAVSCLLLPLVYCHIAASAAGAVLDGSRLEQLADGIRKLSSGVLIAFTAAFTAYLSMAGVLTGSADRAAVKAAKLAVSGAIPVVGGVLSDAAEGVLASAGALRGSVGTLSVFVLLAVCLTPLLRLGVQFLLYKAAAFASGLFGPKQLTGFLDRLGDAFALVFAMTAASATILLAALLTAMTVAAG